MTPRSTRTSMAPEPGPVGGGLALFDSLLGRSAPVFHRDGEPAGNFRKDWAPACRVPGFPTSSSTTCVTRLPEAWCARGGES